MFYCTGTTSEDEDGGVEDAGADEDFPSSVDFGTLQVDLDFDPMECLRIFNESKHVKTEDKGRQQSKGTFRNDLNNLLETGCCWVESSFKKDTKTALTWMLEYHRNPNSS